LNCTAVGARGGIHSLEDIANLIATGTHYPTTAPVSTLS
jgi:sulfofructose kinase